ncbi:MAG: protein translocase subunit SecF [Clostridiales bacterium]|jgi:preprotein translocase SecF subunit|nr:protein translocase subunit SecF [Clostridiales bacterium]
MRIVENRKYYISVSLAVLLIGVIIIIINAASGKGAFNYDVEFSGGTSFQIDLGRDFSNEDIADIVREATGQDAPQIQRVTGTNQVMIRMRSIAQETRTALMDRIKEEYGITDDAFTYSDISATVSADMQSSAILAVVCACAAMLVYVSLRFRDIRMGAAAIMALLHDSLIVIAFYGILRIPLNYSFIAAVLTILGYSINATIVIFDRIRENRSLMRKSPIADLVNVSVSQTMRRSVFTSLTVFIVVLILYILGVASIKEFALPIIIGVIAGGYSSIFLSGTFWYMLTKKPETVPAPRSINKPPVPPKPADTVPSVKKAAGAENNNVRQLSSTPRKKSRRR